MVLVVVVVMRSPLFQMAPRECSPRGQLAKSSGDGSMTGLDITLEVADDAHPPQVEAQQQELEPQPQQQPPSPQPQKPQPTGLEQRQAPSSLPVRWKLLMLLSCLVLVTAILVLGITVVILATKDYVGRCPREGP